MWSPSDFWPLFRHLGAYCACLARSRGSEYPNQLCNFGPPQKSFSLQLGPAWSPSDFCPRFRQVGAYCAPRARSKGSEQQNRLRNFGLPKNNFAPARTRSVTLCFLITFSTLGGLLRSHDACPEALNNKIGCAISDPSKKVLTRATLHVVTLIFLTTFSTFGNLLRSHDACQKL